MVQSWADRKHNWNQCCWTDSFSFYWEQLVLASILRRCVNEHNYFLSQPCLWHFSLTSLLEENPSLSVSVFSFHITAPSKIHQEAMRGSIPYVTVGPRSHKTVRQGQNIDLSNRFIFPQRSLKFVVDQFLLITWLTTIDCIGVEYPGVPPRMWLFLILLANSLPRVRKRRRFPAPRLRSTSTTTVCAIGVSMVVSVQEQKHTFCQEGY